MRKLSTWARRHPRIARICIILLYIPINITGLITGDLLFDLGIHLSGSFLVSAMTLFVITVYCYPNKNNGNQASKESSYIRRKASNLLLITATFLMICFTGNQTNLSTPFYPLAIKIAGYAPASHSAVVKESTVPATDGPFSKKLHRKEVRKQLRHFLQEFRRSYKDHSQGEKGMLIGLTIVAALVLFFLIASLSCSIACGGAEALAYVVFFVGTFGIVFLAIKIIQRITRGRPQSRSGSAPPVSSR